MGHGHGSGGRTNFENTSHAEMIEMVEAARPHELMDRGHALIKAHKDMSKIAHDLKTYMDRVHWDSDSGDAFRSWGHAVAKSTHTLADYSKTAGTHLLSAGETLAGVKKAMPKVPEDALKQLGGDKPGSLLLVNQGEANRAVPGGVHVGVTNLKTANAYDKAEGARQEAIKQMEKLSSHYATAADSISRQEEPKFPALPPEFVPSAPPGAHDSQEYLASGGTARTGAAAASSYKGEQVPEERGESVPYRKPAVSGSFEPEGSTDLDSVQAPPGPSDTTTGDAPPSPVSTGPSGGGPHGVAPPPPVTSLVSPVGLPGGGGGGRSPSGRYGIFGGGREPVSPPRTPAGGQDIVGGRPGPSGPGSGRIPKGTVVGEESQQQSMMRRPPMLGGIGAGHGGSESGRGVSSRRLASQAGGVVGGPRSTGERQEFTPGGSGLRREGADDEQAAVRRPPMMPAAGEEEPRRGERPDYLVEDGDTWDPGRDDVAPPVIE